MTRRNVMATGVLVAVLVSVASCTKHDSLVLLELRSSGPLGAPVVGIRLSANGWPTRTVAAGIGPEGFHVGYYGPGNGKAVTDEVRIGNDVARGVDHETGAERANLRRRTEVAPQEVAQQLRILEVLVGERHVGQHRLQPAR